MRTISNQFLFLIVLFFLFQGSGSASSAKSADAQNVQSVTENAVVLRTEPKNQLVANFDQTGATVIEATVVQKQISKPGATLTDPNALTGKDQEFQDMMNSWKAATSKESFSVEDCKNAGIQDCEQEKNTHTNPKTGSRVFVS